MLRAFSIQQVISFLLLVSLLVLSTLFVLMTPRNSTEVIEFFLLGFGVQHEFQYFLFTVFLVIYGTSMVGNIGMSLLIKTDSRLQTPMYIFLQHLAFVDICFTSDVTPKMMKNFIIENKSISFEDTVKILSSNEISSETRRVIAHVASCGYFLKCTTRNYFEKPTVRECIDKLMFYGYKNNIRLLEYVCVDSNNELIESDRYSLELVVLDPESQNFFID